MAWPTKCTWLPWPTCGKSHSYTLVSKYHKIWKDTKEAVSAKDVSRKEPITGVIALKASMKYFDADFFNDSKVLSKCYLKFSQPSSCINIFFIYTSICSVSFGRWKMVQKNLMYLHLETTGNWWR
jgi:hypothetical protein